MSGPSEAGSPQPAAAPEPAREPSDGNVVEPATEAHLDVPAAEAEAPSPAAPNGEALAVPAPEVRPSAAASDSGARDALLVHGSRIVVLASLLGGAIAFWTQVAFRSPWLDAFLLDNELEPGKRASLLLALVGGFLVGGLAAFVGIELWRRRSRPI